MSTSLPASPKPKTSLPPRSLLPCRLRLPLSAWLPAAALLCLIAGLQLSGGAYRAEFDSDPDEAAHLVSGLIVHDFIASHPAGNPIVWAQQYYLHYPKVAIGHWPPFFYFVEAVWWLIFPPARWSVLFLQAALLFASALVFYSLARTLCAPWLAIPAALLLLTCPIVQLSLDTAMADALCLLLSLLLALSCVHLLARPSGRTLALTGLWIALALLTKGTAACLVPVPFLLLAISGKWRLLRPRAIIACVLALLVSGCAWYGFESLVLHQSLLYGGGLTTSMPWPIDLMPRLAGWGVLLLALGGCVPAFLRRRPVAVTAFAMLLSTVAVSFALRAMNQPRHFIAVLPALLLLTLELLDWLSRWKLLKLAAIALALCLFPWTLYHQDSHGFSAFVRQLPRPARILVSSNSDGEGAMVAAIALSEPRPSSFVVRATKSFSSSGWNGQDYRLTVGSPQAVASLLDELGIDKVELQTMPAPGNFPHHALLLQALHASSAWRECAHSETLFLWCRVSPSRVPRKPLHIDLSNRIGTDVQESPRRP